MKDLKSKEKIKNFENLKSKEKTIDIDYYGHFLRVIVRIKELSSNDKLLYMLLFNLANAKTGKIYPSYKYIGEELGISRMSVFNSLKNLKELGLIDWNNNGQKSNNYYLPFIPDWVIKKYSMKYGDYKSIQTPARNLLGHFNSSLVERFDLKDSIVITGKEIGQAKTLLKKLNNSLENVKEIIDYIISDWKRLKEEWKVTDQYPTIGIVLGFCDVNLMAEAKQRATRLRFYNKKENGE